MKKILTILLVMMLVVSLVGCGGGSDEKPAIKVSCKPWTEQLILGSMTLQYLEAKGYEVEDRTGLGETAVLRPALHSDEIDMYWEYTGTTLMVNMKEDVVTDSVECYNMVKAWDEETNNVQWLDYALANNTYTLMMRNEAAHEKGIETITDLAEYIKDGNDIRLGASIDFIERPDGLEGLETKYDMKFDKDLVNSLEVGLTYEALKNDQIDVGMGFGTDGRIVAMNFTTLEDDEAFFPVYNPAPIIRKEILEAYPELEADLNQLPALLDEKVLQELNKKVDVDGLEPEEVAEAFLKEHNLID
ncbi:MAG: ABC transporter substrate-binding protein [Clostridia bacterium]|nr:ABC transporter substrate-binding protein [Clostridia bacterium]